MFSLSKKLHNRHFKILSVSCQSDFLIEKEMKEGGQFVKHSYLDDHLKIVLDAFRFHHPTPVQNTSGGIIFFTLSLIILRATLTRHRALIQNWYITMASYRTARSDNVAPNAKIYILLKSFFFCILLANDQVDQNIEENKKKRV